jgi:hypothetical protein
MRQKRVNYIFDRKEFFIDLHKIVILMAHETMCKRLALFQIFLDTLSSTNYYSVASCGNSNKLQKVAKHLWKIPNLVFPSPMARASLRKILRRMRHWNVDF